VASFKIGESVLTSPQERCVVGLLCLCTIYPPAYLRNHTAELYQIFVHVDRGRNSVLVQWRCDTLCTVILGFVDDDIFSNDGPWWASFVARHLFS